MTFVDAAIEVLKREGQPLSIRRLAELAVKHNLLSVIGRDPEATMLERLDEAMARSTSHPDLVRIKPDTFGLHAYPPKPAPATKPANGAPAADAKAEGETPAGAADEAKKGRRRRRRGARRAEGAAGEAGDSEGGDDAAEGESAEAATRGVTVAPAKVAAHVLADEAAKASDAASAESPPASAEEPADKAEGEPAVAAGEGAAVDALGEKKRRRRRGGRGRRRQGSPGVDAAEGGGDDEDDDATDAVAAKPATEASDAPAAAPAAAKRANLSADAAESSAVESADAALELAETLPPEAEAAGTPIGDDAAAGTGEELLDSGEDLDADFDHDTGPLLAPAHGAEDVTRTDDDRVVRPEIRGSRDERHRRDHRHKRGAEARHGKPHDKPAHGAGQPHAPRPHAPSPPLAPRPHAPQSHAPQSHAPAPAATTAAASEGPMRDGKPAAGLVEAVLDVLRNSDGRPMHVRLIAETAAKRRLVDARTPPGDLVRLIRMALVGERREREAAGLRARVRNVGGGQFQAADKRLDPELFTAERELGERVMKLGDATRAVIRRRVGRLAPPAFEALGRTLCEKLGIHGIELIRRGEGVAYFGGTRTAGAGSVRTLVALRPSESEINRRAVGELRAGLAAKGFDEGLLFAGGNPNTEALTELKHGGVTLYDGPALAALLIEHGLGVRRVAIPVDYLDLDFFGELTEG